MFPNPPRVVHLNKEPYDIRIDYPHKWGNPFHGPTTMSAKKREKRIAQYHNWLLTQPQLLEIVATDNYIAVELAGQGGESVGC